MKFAERSWRSKRNSPELMPGDLIRPAGRRRPFDPPIIGLVIFCVETDSYPPSRLVEVLWNDGAIEQTSDFIEWVVRA